MAVLHTLKREGVFSDDENDSGGATRYGVASNIWPAWYARILDEPTENGRIEIAIQFYHDQFWTKMQLDELHAERIALEIFDTAVNCGISRAARIAQEAINLFITARGTGQFVKEDGVFGTITRGALNTISQGYAENLDGILNWVQGNFYMTLFKQNPEKYGDFIIGWFRRVQTH